MSRALTTALGGCFATGWGMGQMLWAGRYQCFFFYFYYLSSLPFANTAEGRAEEPDGGSSQAVLTPLPFRCVCSPILLP